MALQEFGTGRFPSKGGRARHVFRGFGNNMPRIVSVEEPRLESRPFSEDVFFQNPSDSEPRGGVRNRLEKTALLDIFAPESGASMTNFEAHALLPKLNHLVTYDTGGSSVGGSDVLQEIIETQIKRFLMTTTQDAFNQKMNALEESRSGILDDIGCRLREQEDQLQDTYNPNDLDDPTMRRVKNALGAYEFSSERIFSEIVARMQSEDGTQKALAGSGEIRTSRANQARGGGWGGKVLRAAVGGVALVTGFFGPTVIDGRQGNHDTSQTASARQTMLEALDAEHIAREKIYGQLPATEPMQHSSVETLTEPPSVEVPLGGVRVD